MRGRMRASFECRLFECLSVCDKETLDEGPPSASPSAPLS